MLLVESAESVPPELLPVARRVFLLYEKENIS